jgi:hypothetical protein
VPQTGFGREKRAIQVDCEQPLPVGESKIDDRADDLNAGVTNQHVDPAVFCHGVGDAFLHSGLVGHVHCDREGIAAFAPNLLGRRFGGIEIEIGNHGDAALGRKTQRNVLADPTGGAGDDRNLSVKSGHFRILPSCETVTRYACFI